ncbi:MAG: hypothetical protein COY40_03445 [Alphaproteobacteria bacterium CG_4_10_14_0_8_um_filter_53_9]|nr:MAG: hypothetical protein COY40_03445 [Alphaproteobacteria bacterium CG_4_10_14_0_8_um_filter_53_9]
MFGLDARIALGIFAVIAMVAGGTMVMNLDDQKAKALASEVADTGKAIEAIHYDLKADLWLSLLNPSEKNAFMALYDNGVIMEEGQRRGRWNGPYIRATSNRHNSYGEMLLRKRQENHKNECTDPLELCYVWLVYGKVKPGVAESLNQFLDDKELAPETTGRVQWTPDGDYVNLYYRATKALSTQTD